MYNARENKIVLLGLSKGVREKGDGKKLLDNENY
jgi:hypothetical protein